MELFVCGNYVKDINMIEVVYPIEFNKHNEDKKCWMFLVDLDKSRAIVCEYRTEKEAKDAHAYLLKVLMNNSKNYSQIT